MEQSLLAELINVIDKIERFLLGLNFDSFRNNEIIVSGVSYELIQLEDIIKRANTIFPAMTGTNIVTLKYIRSAAILLHSSHEAIRPVILFRISTVYLPKLKVKLAAD